MAEKSNAPKYIDDLTVREIYVEVTQVLIDTVGNLRVELGVLRREQNPPFAVDRAVPLIRFAIPVGVARGLRDQLTANIESVAQQVSAVGQKTN